MDGGRSASPSAGVGAGVARSSSHKASVALVKATSIPSGSASDLPQPFCPSCDLLPPRLCGRGGSSPGDEGRAYQPLPTDRTALWRRFSPPLASALPVDRCGRLHQRLAQLLPTQRQLLPLTVGIQTPAAHPHGSGGGHMKPPTPQELLNGQAHRPLCRLALGAFGPPVYRKTTCWPSHVSSRALESGPPRR